MCLASIRGRKRICCGGQMIDRCEETTHFPLAMKQEWCTTETGQYHPHLHESSVLDCDKWSREFISYPDRRALWSTFQRPGIYHMVGLQTTHDDSHHHSNTRTLADVLVCSINSILTITKIILLNWPRGVSPWVDLTFSLQFVCLTRLCFSSNVATSPFL